MASSESTSSTQGPVHGPLFYYGIVIAAMVAVVTLAVIGWFMAATIMDAPLTGAGGPSTVPTGGYGTRR